MREGKRKNVVRVMILHAIRHRENAIEEGKKAAEKATSDLDYKDKCRWIKEDEKGLEECRNALARLNGPEYGNWSEKKIERFLSYVLDEETFYIPDHRNAIIGEVHGRICYSRSIVVRNKMEEGMKKKEAQEWVDVEMVRDGAEFPLVINDEW